MKQDELIRLFAGRLRRILERGSPDWERLQEIRLRVNEPFLMLIDGKEYFLTEEGGITGNRQKACLVSGEEIRETLEYISSYSLYAFAEELRQGFLTVPGGHRVGVAGRVILEGERIKGMQHISYLNIRVSHQKKGCADQVLPYVIGDGKIHHTLLISPPRCGKTTLLRDLIRQISDGTKEFPGCTVGVVDERSELGGSYLGIPQNDLGIRTDLLDCCPKAEGMLMLVRSMAPAVIAVDEIGGDADIRALETVLHCGCRLLATVHGDSMEDVRCRPLLGRLVSGHVFERYVVLEGGRAGVVRDIFDSRGTRLYGRGTCLC